MRRCSAVLLVLITIAAVLLLFSPSPAPTPPPAAAVAIPVARLVPSLPGLSDLYPAPANSSAHLSWRLLRPLLLRSDALPGTAEGVLEAASAWRNLTVSVTEVEEGRRTRGSLGRGASCPASVEGDPSSGSARIPCGLLEGSAVTVVGVPREGAAQFVVEMVGAAGEVVVRVNVSLAATGMVVEQSSWTPEAGWGELERCPPSGDVGSSHNSLQRSTVDGLVCCNVKVGANHSNGTSMNVTQNQPEDEKRHRVSDRLSGGFTIVEGEPFTVTLWAGVEGFHMTVNGRHETSFAYREVFARGWSHGR